MTQLRAEQLMKGFEKLGEARKEYAKLYFQYKTLKQLAPVYEMHKGALYDEFQLAKDGSTESFVPSCRCNPHLMLPEYIYVDKIKAVDLKLLLLKAQETLVWRTFTGLLRSSQLPQLVLCFPVKGHKTWVIHNLRANITPGVARVVVPSNSAHYRDAHIVPLTTFITESKN